MILAGMAGGSALLGANEARGARKDAKRAAGQQAAGVEAARDDTLAATNRGRAALSGLDPTSQAVTAQTEMPQIQARLDELNAIPTGSRMLGGRVVGGMNTADASAINAERSQLEQQLAGLKSASQMSIDTTKQAGGMTQAGGQAVVDPRQELLGGIGGQLGFTDQGFQSSAGTLSPLAQMAMPFIDEQSALLGFGGEEARQGALGRVADPLQAEQERAFMRNNAQFGGVGGNALSALAEQTRARTEANIGNRLSQLGSAASPSLNALQQMSNLQLNRGLSMSDIMGGAGRDLASQETSRRQALANMELGQGSELAQLSQNLGTARAGGSAFAAQNPSPLSAGLNSGLNTFLAMGGMRQAPPSGGMVGGGGTVNPNRFERVV